MKSLVRMIALLFFICIAVGEVNVSHAAGREQKLSITVKMQDRVAWTAFLEGEDAGTTGQKRRLEGISLRCYNPDHKVEYQIYTPDAGWSAWKADGEKLTNGGGEAPITAFRIKVSDRATGVLLDVQYRAHVAYVGWMDYVSNGKEAGDFKNRIEAITIKFEGKMAGSKQVDDLFKM